MTTGTPAPEPTDATFAWVKSHALSLGSVAMLLYALIVTGLIDQKYADAGFVVMACLFGNLLKLGRVRAWRESLTQHRGAIASLLTVVSGLIHAIAVSHDWASAIQVVVGGSLPSALKPILPAPEKPVAVGVDFGNKPSQSVVVMTDAAGNVTTEPLPLDRIK